jgi:hypothetical protein
MSETPTIRIAGTEYVVVPKADYLRLQRVAGAREDDRAGFAAI